MKTPKKSEPARAQKLSTSAGEQASPRGRHSVIIVDDHPMTRAGLVQLINQEPDLRVIAESSSAAEALSQLEKKIPDLLITDVALPGRSGLELVKDARALHPNLAVLVISMHDELIHAARALRAGALGYVMKEAGAAVILKAVRRVLGGHVYVSEQMSERIFEVFSHRRTVESPIDALTDRELEIFELIGFGHTTKNIARRLNLSTKTVDSHRANIKLKLNCPDIATLVRQAVCWVEQEGRNVKAGA